MTPDIFGRIEHGRTADAVVRQIESLVLEGVLRVGDRLPGERELSRRLDVSRPILREALKELETRGLLLSRQGDGTRVADVIGQVFSEPVRELVSRHRKATLDYLEYRRDVEGIAAAYAARRATAADRDLLGRIVTAMRGAFAEDDFAREAALDVEFHSAVGECAHNIILLHTLRSCYRLLSEGVFYNRTLIYTFAGAREALLAQHMAIHDAVIAGDAAAARAAAAAHIDFVAASVHEAERSSDWERVSKLRLEQRRATPAVTGTSHADAETIE
ncbi:MAG: FCD domain-containing protein [Pararhizobium sp.]